MGALNRGSAKRPRRMMPLAQTQIKFRKIRLSGRRIASVSKMLLAAKLYIPPIRSANARCPLLAAQLNDGLTGKLTLVSTRAGSGKMTLLARWIVHEKMGGAWRLLDEEYNVYLNLKSSQLLTKT